MAQDLAVPPKWYERFEHVPYVRPNFDEELSPLNSLSFDPAAVDKERKARKTLRLLLEQQADINENLSDENQELSSNQRALLGLLQARDRQLESVSTTAGSVLLSAPRSGSRPSLARLSFRLAEEIKRRAINLWRLRAGSKGCVGVLRTVAAGKIEEALRKIGKKRRCEGWRQLKTPKALLQLLALLRSRLLATGLSALRLQLASGRTYQRASAVTQLMYTLSRPQRAALKALYCTSSNDPKGALKTLAKALRAGRSRVLRRWREAAIVMTVRRVREDKQSAIAKITDFSKRFLKLNQLCSIFSKRERIVQLRRLLLWRVHPVATECLAAVTHLQLVFRKVLKRAFARLCRSRLLPRLLADLVLKRTYAGLLVLKLTQQSASFSLQEQLQTLQFDRDKLDQRLAQALKRASDAEVVRAAMERERELESESAQESVRELTVKLRRSESEAERDKLGWAQELKRQAEELATLKSQQSRLEGQLSQSMHERNKLQASEAESRKQLTALSASVDRLVEERDEALEQVSGYEGEIHSLRAQLEASKKPSLAPKRETLLESRIKDLESALQTAQLTYETKAAQKQKEVTSLQVLCTELKGQLEAEGSEKVRRLSRDNAGLFEKNEELQRELGTSKATSGQLSAQVLKLNKDITDLKVKTR